MDRDANGYADPFNAFDLAFVFNLDRDANGYAGPPCTRKALTISLQMAVHAAISTQTNARGSNMTRRSFDD